jgi:nitrogen fixation NifU-like protein
VSETYTERLLDHYRNPRNEGSLAAPDLYAEEYNPLCGDRVRIELRVAQGQVVEAGFTARGCALCRGSASILTEMVHGRSLAELKGVSTDGYLEQLESAIRPARLKCALLPWVAFRHAAYGEDEWPE